MKIKLFLVSVLALFLVSGCEEKNPSIATTVYPVQYLVERIGGDDVTVSNITENTMIQRAQIKSSFQDILKDSDALFYIGGLEPYMDLYVDDIRDTGVDMVDLATKSAIYKFERYTSTTIDGVTAGEHADLFSPWAYPVNYTVGQIRRYTDGKLYKCLQAHTSQADWTPDTAVSLWVSISDPAEEWPEWSQPLGAHDAYSKGAKVSHNGKHWISDLDANVWEPGQYGWTEAPAEAQEE